MKRVLALFFALAVVSCQDDSQPLAPIQGERDALAPSAGAGEPMVAGRFIVTLRAGTDPVAMARGHGVAADFFYRHALIGFAGPISEAARQGLLRDARVLRVEPDGIATIVTTQSNATWGLDRIDQRNLPLSTTYSYASTGSGVTAYVIDTGIRITHNEFGSRASSGFDAIDGGSADDCHGHGTHVAGTVGGSTYGVAKGIDLVAVRVLNCSGSGTWSQVIAGIDWVTGNHGPGAEAVANLSLGGSANNSVDTAVRNMIGDGVATAIAAGNGNFAGVHQNACKSSPARVSEAMTISATDNTDTKASWANYGNCVDWFAPGVGITSAWSTGNAATKTISGTSMATPHTAGVAALYLQSHDGASPQTVRDALYANTTKGIVKKSRSTNNHLLFTNY